MVEYGLMVAVIALVVAAGAAALGIGIDALFDSADACVSEGDCPE
jgi:Flp pilus assembly pilin Flp